MFGRSLCLCLLGREIWTRQVGQPGPGRGRRRARYCGFRRTSFSPTRTWTHQHQEEEARGTPCPPPLDPYPLRHDSKHGKPLWSRTFSFPGAPHFSFPFLSFPSLFYFLSFFLSSREKGVALGAWIELVCGNLFVCWGMAFVGEQQQRNSTLFYFPCSWAIHRRTDHMKSKELRHPCQCPHLCCVVLLLCNASAHRSTQIHKFKLHPSREKGACNKTTSIDSLCNSGNRGISWGWPSRKKKIRFTFVYPYFRQMHRLTNPF